MEKTNGRKPRILNMLLVAVILVTAVVAVPSTNAKYTTSKKYNIKITTVKSFFLDYTTDTGPKEITLPYVGKYLIIAKGGDGADGCDNDGSSYDVNYNGGEGGYVWAIYTSSAANEKLYACPGAAGQRQGRQSSGLFGLGSKAAPGEGGKNTGANGYAGGNGNYHSQAITGSFSDDTASGGGGAATVVFAGTSNTGTKLLIAGGGGAAASRNVGYSFTEEAGIGGDGGKVTSPYSLGTVFAGSNGTTPVSDNSNLTYGRGASGNSAGIGGTAAKTSVRVLFSSITINQSSGSSGTTAGVGGQAADYGGGGGGGYCGGGGGAGTSINFSSGGGGGGSSFVANNSKLSVVTGENLTTANNILNNRSVEGTTIGVPTQYPGTTSTDENSLNSTGFQQYGHGYVIVYYLGS